MQTDQEDKNERMETDLPSNECEDSALGLAKASNKLVGATKLEEGEGQVKKAFDNGALSQAECLKFRDSLFEVIEELRIRRVTDAENEERISQLLRDKHQLERTREEEAGATTELEKKHGQEISDLHRQYKEQIQQAEDCKNKNTLDLETSEREIKALKEEVQTLHMCKYSLEQKVKEQERQLKLQACARDSHLSQMTEMEQKCSSLFLQCRQLTETHDRLEKSVNEAIRINKKLSSVNKHQTCLLKMHDEALEAQKREVQVLKVQGHCKLNNSNVTSSDEHNSLHLLQQELKIQQDLIKQLKLQLEEIRKEKTKAVSSLQGCQRLVDRHVESCSLLKQKLEVVELELKNLKNEHEGLKESFDTQAQELQSLKDVHKDAFKKWGEQETSLQSRLKTLQEDYGVLEKAHNNLEELNTSWAKKNIKMTEEINSLTNNKTAKDSQIEMVSVYSQTDLFVADSSTQTAIQDKGLSSKNLEVQDISALNSMSTNDTPMASVESDEKMDTTDSSSTEDKEAAMHFHIHEPSTGHSQEDMKLQKPVENVTKRQDCIEIDLTDEVNSSEQIQTGRETQKPMIDVTYQKAEAKDSTKPPQGSKLMEEFERIDKVFQEVQESKSGDCGRESSSEKNERCLTTMPVGMPSDHANGAELPSSSSATNVAGNNHEKLTKLNCGEATGQYQYKFVSIQQPVPTSQSQQEKCCKQHAPGEVGSCQTKGESRSQQGQTNKNEWEELAKSFEVQMPKKGAESYK